MIQIYIILSTILIITLYYLLYRMVKRNKISLDIEKGIAKEAKTEYTIKKEYNARRNAYYYFAMEGRECVGCCDTLEEAKKVLLRAMNAPEPEIVYSTNNKSNESLTNK